MSFFLKPIITEKTCFLAKNKNILSFLVSKKVTKDQISSYTKETLNLEVKKIATIPYTKKNLKKIYIYCKKKYPIHKIWEI